MGPHVYPGERMINCGTPPGKLWYLAQINEQLWDPTIHGTTTVSRRKLFVLHFFIWLSYELQPALEYSRRAICSSDARVSAAKLQRSPRRRGAMQSPGNFCFFWYF